MADGVLLEITDVSKSYGPIRALKEVSFDLAPGEVHALLGHNGAGKSTLVKIISGLVSPDSGDVRMRGEEVDLRTPQQAQALGIALVDQELSVVPALTVEDNLLLGNIHVSFTQRRGAMRSRLRSILDRMGLDHVPLARPVADLSLGERQLLEVARALSRDARVLILDEPTATLSEGEIERVFRAVREFADSEDRAVIYVSHRLSEVLALCQRATIFRDGRRIATEPIENLDRDQIVRLMLGDLPPEPELPVVVDGGERAHNKIRGLSVPRCVLKFDLDMDGGEIIGLAGQVGSGTGDVLRALAGLIPEARGEVLLSGRPMRLGSPRASVAAGAIYASNDRKGEGLFLSHSIESNLTATRLENASRWGVVIPAKAAAIAQRLLDLIGIDRKRRHAPVGELSGGNQQKVFLGRCLEMSSAELLMLDEPTRGVDVGGRADIHHLVRTAAAAGSAVVFASSELLEVLDLADVVVTMFAGQIVSVRPRRDVTAATVLAEMTHGSRAEEVAA